MPPRNPGGRVAGCRVATACIAAAVYVAAIAGATTVAGHHAGEPGGRREMTLGAAGRPLVAERAPVVERAGAVETRVLRRFIAEGAAGSGYLPGDRDLATWAFDDWARHAAGAFRWEMAAEDEALVRLSWAPPNGSTYGEMRRVFVNGRPGATVSVRPDVEGLGPDIARRAADDPLWRDAIVYLTCLHEIGHALDLPHTADSRDIMYSFAYGGDIVGYFARYRRRIAVRDDIRSISGLSDADIRTLRALHRSE